MAADAGDAGLTPGREASLERELAPHSSILARRVMWPEQPGRLQSTGAQESDTTERLERETSVISQEKSEVLVKTGEVENQANYPQPHAPEGRARACVRACACVRARVCVRVRVCVRARALGLPCCTRAFSSCAEQGLHSPEVRGPLTWWLPLPSSTGAGIAGSVAAVRGLVAWRRAASSWTRDSPVPPASPGGVLTAGPPGKP